MAKRVSDLKHDQKNARKHTVRGIEMITDALLDVGPARSIVIDENDRVLAGNGVKQAAAQAGINNLVIVDGNRDTLVAVRRTDLSEEEKTRLALYDNRTGELSTFDADVLKQMRDEGTVLEKYWTQEELAKLFPPKSEDKPEPITDPGPRTKDAAALHQQWATAPGQLWEIPSLANDLLRHRLYIGDATDDHSISYALVRQRAALAVTAPPPAKDTADEGIGEWYEDAKLAIRTLVDCCDVVCWNVPDYYLAGDQFTEPAYSYSINIFAELGWRMLWTRVWHKTVRNYGANPYHLTSNRPVAEFEYIGAFTADGERQPVAEIGADDYEWVLAFANPMQFSFVARLSPEERRQWGYSGVWSLEPIKGKRTKDGEVVPFPTELPTRCIKLHSDPGQTVIDPYCGTGTTLIACEQTGRAGAGVERDPRIAAVALQRCFEAGMQPQLIFNGQ